MAGNGERSNVFLNLCRWNSGISCLVTGFTLVFSNLPPKWMPTSAPTLFLTHVALLSSSGRNFLSTSELIRLPDDCTVGYIIECKVGGQLIPNALFHSHLENLQLIPSSQLMQQVRRGKEARGRCVRKGKWREAYRHIVPVMALKCIESIICSSGEAFLTSASLK